MKKYLGRIPAHTPPQSFESALQQVLPYLSRSTLRTLILSGFAYVNGKRLTVPHTVVRGGVVLQVYWDPQKLPRTITKEQFLPLRVLYEDEAIICFDKPALLPTHPTLDAKRPNLYDLALEQLKEALPQQTVYLGIHHRLDRDTSGVVLFTREKKHNVFIGKQFEEHLCSKTYIAVVHGRIPRRQGRLESYLGQVGKAGRQKINKFGSVKNGGKKAITEFSVISNNKNYSLLEVNILTGRTHQIRVHLSEMGHPIVGDTLYGSPESHYTKYQRHLLHAHALSITHPITENVVRIESPVPPEFRALCKGVTP